MLYRRCVCWAGPRKRRPACLSSFFDVWGCRADRLIRSWWLVEGQMRPRHLQSKRQWRPQITKTCYGTLRRLVPARRAR